MEKIILPILYLFGHLAYPFPNQLAAGSIVNPPEAPKRIH